MDMGPEPDHLLLRMRPDAEELWDEHGWGLTWQQTGAIFAVIALASAVLKMVAG